jgi:galactonate dehydratase
VGIIKGPVITAVSSHPYWPERAIKPQLLVKLETTDGVVGWGEAGFTFRERAVAATVEHLADIIIGRDAFDIGALWQELYRRDYYEGCRTTSAALSAIDIALHDLKAKALGVAVYDLLGGRQRDRIPCFATTRGDDVAETVAHAEDLVARGFDAVRLHVLPKVLERHAKGMLFDPRTALAQTAEMTIAVRERLGARVMLGIDLHHRFSPAEAISYLSRLPRSTLDFLEEPIRAESVSAYRQLRGSTDVPFAVGEEFISKAPFRDFIEAGLMQFARVDLANCGGLTEGMKIAGLAEAHYVDAMPHNPLGPVNTAASLHFCAAIPNLSFLEARAFQITDPLSIDAHIFPRQPLMEGAFFPLSPEPGLGVTVDEAALAEEVARYRHGHHIRLVRPDGSFTNS